MYPDVYGEAMRSCHMCLNAYAELCGHIIYVQICMENHYVVMPHMSECVWGTMRPCRERERETDRQRGRKREGDERERDVEGLEGKEEIEREDKGE